MNAAISGRAGMALLIEGNTLMSFDVDDPNTCVPRRQADLPFLFGDASDLQFLEDVDRAQVAQELERAYNSSAALDLTLIALDSELSDETRAEAIDALEELLIDADIELKLESVLYGRPLPDAADIDGALSLRDKSQANRAYTLLERLRENQPSIRLACSSWDGIPVTMFGGVEEQTKFHHTAIQEGLFRDLAIRRGNEEVNQFLINSLWKPSIKALKNHRTILQQWVKPFRITEEPQVIRPEIEEETESNRSSRKSKGRRAGINREVVLANVESQKRLIIDSMQRREIGRAREIIDQLIEYQLRYGGSKFLVKSLCDLAVEAKALGMYSLQLELTERSINLEPDDAWSWTQYGDALLNMQEPNEALRAYEQAYSFGAGAVAKRGRAEVLKALGHLDKALAAYDEVIAEHPGDVIAKSGRAEVLKALGRFENALAAYDEVIVEHPENVIAKRKSRGIEGTWPF